MLRCKRCRTDRAPVYLRDRAGHLDALLRFYFRPEKSSCPEPDASIRSNAQGIKLTASIYNYCSSDVSMIFNDKSTLTSLIKMFLCRAAGCSCRQFCCAFISDHVLAPFSLRHSGFFLLQRERNCRK